MDESPQLQTQAVSYRFAGTATCRDTRRLQWVYNYFVNSPLPMSLYDMQFGLTGLKEERLFLRKYHSKMLQKVAKEISAAGKALDTLKSNGHITGKSKHVRSEDYNSFTYNQSGFDLTVDEILRLSKIGKVAIKLHRNVESIKQVTVKREGKKWFAVICCKVAEQIFKFVDTKKSVGISKFTHDSDNPKIVNAQFLKKLICPVRRASRRVSRKQVGSIPPHSFSLRPAPFHSALSVLFGNFNPVQHKRNDISVPAFSTLF